MSNVRVCLVVSVNGCARVILRLCISACVRAYMGVFTHDLPHVSRSHSLFAAQFAEAHLYSTVQSKKKKRKRKKRESDFSALTTTDKSSMAFAEQHQLCFTDGSP